MKTRIKTGHTPGDVSKSVKQAMLEGRHPERRRSKAYKRELLKKERTVLRERTRVEVARQLDDS